MGKKRTVVGKFVHTTWNNLHVRCVNGKYRQIKPKNNCYNNVEIRFTQKEFKNWCWGQKNLIEMLNRPSIDRISSSGHYTIDNIQIVELKDNIRKDKTIFKDGFGKCPTCQEIKLENLFVVDKRRSNNHGSICKACDSVRTSRRVK